MNSSKPVLRRLILGLSIEDAQSKFDSPESRLALRVAHERYNHGIYQELHIAQQQRNRLPPDRKCHISRFAKPSVAGFQAYVKDSPDDYIIREIWTSEEPESTAAAPAAAADSDEHKKEEIPNSAGLLAALPRAPLEESKKIAHERKEFSDAKKVVLQTLTSALETVAESVDEELTGRRESGSLLAPDQQVSVVDRLVGDVAESTDKGYKTLSSSSHLLEPVEVSISLFSKKEKDIASAFNSTMITVPAKEGCISYSLWVAGGIIGHEELIQKFPFHLAKHAASSQTEATSPLRLPRAEVDIYFSPHVYQLLRTIGNEGIAMLRQFIGRCMQRQHEPTPTSSSLLLNPRDAAEVAVYNIFHTSGSGSDGAAMNDEIQIPWIHKTITKISTSTGAVLKSEDSKENPTPELMRDSLRHVWKAWGHLIKDLHVHGDLDYLYVSIDRTQDREDGAAYLDEVKELEQARERTPSTTQGSAALEEKPHGSGVSPSSSALAYLHTAKKQRYLPVSADFAVVECVLERKGLPHKLVMEDITAVLADMQECQLEVERLTVVDAAELTEATRSSSTGSEASVADTERVVPVLYKPNIVLTHAGAIQNNSHSFQKIRIRGANVAHVRALAEALQEENGSSYFTNRAMPAMQARRDGAAVENLSFQAVRSKVKGDGEHHSPRGFGGAATGIQRMQSSQSRAGPDDPASSLVTADEREFWSTHYYRLSDVQLIFHHRVDAEDALQRYQGSVEKLPRRLRDQLQLLAQRRSAGNLDAEEGEENEEGNAFAAQETTKSKRGGKQAAAKAAARGRRKTKAVLAMPSIEKLFEYLCTDMEAETALYDLKAGDCSGYDYNITLTRIPDKEFSQVAPALKSLSTKGFLNYVGPQRFGSYTAMNMHPGLHLLRGEFAAAAHVLVQQFYLDASVEAERRRTGSAFPPLQGMKGFGYRLSDFSRGSGRRSVAEQGTAMQKVLFNAIQASSLLGYHGDVRGEDNLLSGESVVEASSSSMAAAGGSDPCAEAFLRVLGPRVCAMLVHEFLSFVWNDILNQRIQRYGTFSLLPGDLVLPAPRVRGGTDAELSLPVEPVHVSQKEIASGNKTVWDLVLPLPGAGVKLPENHTTDLYIVTLKRHGLAFNPETRQWGCFYGRPEDGLGSGKGAAASSAPLSPYHHMTSSFALMEEELGAATPVADRLVLGWVGPSSPALSGVELGDVRADLRHQQCNPLGVTIQAAYRHALVQPDASVLQWSLRKGLPGDPHRRWGEARQSQYAALQKSAPVPLLSPLEDGLTMVGSKGTPSSVAAASSTPAATVYLRHKNAWMQRRKQQQRAPNQLRSYFAHLNTSPITSEDCLQKTSGASPTSAMRVATTPHWLPRHHDTRLQLQLRLPPGVYPAMLLRELTKMDVNTPEVVDLNRVVGQRSGSSVASAKTALGGGQALTSEQQAVYDKYLAKRRHQKRFTERPQAISLALLHQQLFRSSGIRNSLLPTLRSYDSVSK